MEIHCKWKECYTWQSKHRHNDVAKSSIYPAYKHAQHNIHQSLKHDANLTFGEISFEKGCKCSWKYCMSLPLLQPKLHHWSHCDSITVHKLFLHFSDKDTSQQTHPNVGKTLQQSVGGTEYTAQQMVCNKHLQAIWLKGLMTSPRGVNCIKGFTK
jgi:hypothetical protein